MLKLLYIITPIILVFRFWLLKNLTGLAVDQNYWLLYRKKAREQKKIPPNIENYILEIKQWYPPIFGWFISYLPDRFIKNPIFLITFLNLFRVGVLLFFFWYSNSITPSSTAIVIIIFFTAPILIYYENQINSRIFGSIILDLIILLWVLFFESKSFGLLIIISILSTLLIFTHKMTTQLLLIIIIGVSIFNKSLYPILTVSVAFLVGYLFFDYSKYFRHHVEILKFWDRNKFNLGSHQFYESKLYGSKNFIFKNRIHGGGSKTFKKKIILLGAMFPMLFLWGLNFELNTISVIILSSSILIIITTFFKWFYALGYGIYYFYNIVTFVCMYFLYSPLKLNNYNLAILVLCLISSTLSIIIFYKRKTKIKSNLDLIEVITFIKKSSLDRLFVIPYQLPDEIAFKTNRKVFWGGHGLGFWWLERYYPVIKDPLENAISDWNLGAVILEKKYWQEFFSEVDQKIFTKVFENKSFAILKVNNWVNIDMIPNWANEKYPNLIKY